jgi:hypothetical protein
MPTNKPQFNVYLDTTTAGEIDRYAENQGYKKGKLIEIMWRFFMLRDLGSLHGKLAAHIAKGVTDRERAVLYQIYKLLKPLFADVQE